MRCPAQGHPTPTIQWLKDGEMVEQISRPHNQRPYLTKPEKWELKIHGVQDFDQGTYTCIVSNKWGIIKHEYDLEVLQFIRDKPVLIETSDNLTLLAGMDAHFYCHFESDLSMILHWLRPAKSIRESGNAAAILDGSNASHFESITDQNNKPLDEEEMTIYNVQPEDAGLYFCVGQTNAGMTPGFLHLTVLEEDEAILQPPKNVTVEAGKSAYFKCTSHGTLREMTSWVKLVNGVNLTELAVGTEVLELEAVTYEDEGLYCCVVGNEVAHVQAMAYLTVVEPETVAVPSMATRHNLKVRANSYNVCGAFHIEKVSMGGVC